MIDRDTPTGRTRPRSTLTPDTTPSADRSARTRSVDLSAVSVNVAACSVSRPSIGTVRRDRYFDSRRRKAVASASEPRATTSATPAMCTSSFHPEPSASSVTANASSRSRASGRSTINNGTPLLDTAPPQPEIGSDTAPETISTSDGHQCRSPLPFDTPTDPADLRLLRQRPVEAASSLPTLVSPPRPWCRSRALSTRYFRI